MKKGLKILLLALAGFIALTFTAYITNADMKLVERIYDALIKYHDSKRVEEKI